MLEIMRRNSLFSENEKLKIIKTELTHNKHIFLRSKRCAYYGKSAYFGENYIIRIKLFVYNFRKIFSDLKMFLVFLVDFRK